MNSSALRRLGASAGSGVVGCSTHALNVRPEPAIADVRARPGFRRNLADQTRPALPLPKTTNVIGELPH
jgi:hypothetical protein